MIPNKNMLIPSSDSVAPTITINPGNIRSAIDGGYNLQLQDMIETLIRVDAHFSGKIQDRLSVLRKAKFNFIPASEDKKDVEICEFVQNNLEQVLNKNILKHMLNAIFRKFSVTEIIWKLQDNKYIIKELKKLPPRAFEFSKKLDGHESEENHLMLYDYDSDEASEIPINKTIQTFAAIEFEDRVVSITEIIAILIVIKYYALQKDWPRFNELFAIPMRLGTYPEGTSNTDVDALFVAVKSLGSDAAGVIGGLTKIELLQPKDSSPEQFEKIINHCNNEISKAISGQSGTSESGEKSSYASMKVLNGIREDIAQDSLDIVSDAINLQLIKPLVDFNFTVDQYPTFEIQLPINLNELLDIDVKFKNLGLKFTKEYFMKRYNLSEEDFDIIETNQSQIFNQLLEKDLYIQRLLKKKALNSQTPVDLFS